MMGYGRGLGGPSGGGFYQNKYALEDEYGDEDEMDDYGMYYAEDDSEDIDPQFAQNYNPGSMFQGQPKMGAAAMGKGPINSVGGVPFYGQQQPKPAGGGFTYGGIGGGAGGFMSGAMPSSFAPTTGGGFTYGMASKGGNLFGPPTTGSNPLMGGTQFGASSATATSNPGLFQFGKVSNFGGIGGGVGGASTFGAGAAGGLFGGAAVADDPYANIAIDLNKVKKQEAPVKLHEHKSEEEKKKEAEEKKNQSNAAGKSNLKKEFEDKKKEEDEDVANRRKRSVTFGKSTTYEVERGETDESTEFINKDNVGGRGSPRPSDKKVIEEKDLSDGRSEKQKILEMLEKQQREQLEELNKLNDIQPKTQDKKASIEESIGESSSLSVPPVSQPKKKQEDNSNSYESDDFEEISASASGSKQKITQWPGKDAYKQQQDSVSQSQSMEKDNAVYDANAMDEYLKKQQQNKTPIIQLKQQAKKTEVESESSDRYDDDFESMSKSQSALTASMLQGPQSNQQNQKQTFQAKSTFEYKPQPTAEFKSIAEQYKKKENKFIQTEETKYDFMSPQQQTSGSYKEWTLQQNLKDAESLIQDLKSNQAEFKQKIQDLELQLKKKDMDYQTMRRESLNAGETAKRLQEQLKDAIHKNNLYKIETEELIKQIDLADAKTRNKEDELKLAQAEYDRKLKLQEERILFRISKQEERGTIEMKREHMIEKEELQTKIQEQQEEIDYLMQKVTKIEVENKSLRIGKDSNKRVKELEEEIDMLKHQLSTTYQVQQENINLRNIKNELSKEDQVKLQRELQQLELMVKGYQEENEKAMFRQKQLEKELKLVQEKAFNEARRVKDLQQKVLLTTEKVYIEEAKEELDIQTVNNMGLSNAISQKTLQDLHNQLQKLMNEKQDVERDIAIKEGQLRSQINKLREEKNQVDKQLIDTEFLLGDKDREIQKIRDEFRVSKEQMTQQIQELEEKISWFRQNQRLISEEDQEKDNVMQELYQLREKSKKLEEDNRRTRDLEKKCKLLEETIKSKNPNSIPMLLQAVKETNQNEKTQNQQEQERIRELERELEDKDREFEKKLRTLRQEQERIKQMYEKRQGQTPEAKRIQELEDELQKTKNYYNKRIREIEDKYKFRIPEKDNENKNSSKPPQSKQSKEQTNQQTVNNDETKNYEEIIERLTKERNLMAQKVVNLETMNNKRRQSFSGNQQLPFDDQKYAQQAIFSIANLLKQNSNQKPLAFSLIESALTCVELLKNKDPQRNKQLSQHLLQLTQDLNTTSKVNDKILSEMINLCQQDTQSHQQNNQQFNDLKLRHMNSASGPTLNKDIQNIMNDGEQKVANKSPNNRPPKPITNPFTVNSQPQRNIKDLLKSIVQSGVDFERIASENKFNKNKIQVNQLYQILREEDQSLKNITLDEVKSLISYVREKSGVASEEISGGKIKTDEIDLQELINVVMDVSLDVFGAQDQSYNFLNDSNNQIPTRYSMDKIKSPEDQSKNREQLRKLQEEKDQYYQGIQKMQSTLNQLTSEKRELLNRVERLEMQKNRVEKILKQSLGNKQTLRKTNGNEIDNNEIFDELSVVMKRIEYLEQQSEEREKLTYQEHGPCKREILRLQQELEEEKVDKSRLLAKKNAEVSYFKSELDALLSEMKNTINNKKQQRSIKF